MSRITNLPTIIKEIIFFPDFKSASFNYLKKLPILAWICFLTTALIIANSSQTSIDILSYLDYFEGTRIINYASWWAYFIDEPVWRIYTFFMGSLFDSGYAYLLTLFISIVAFLSFGSILGRGGWILVFFAFLFDSTLATQMYYNQIRQGFALSTFMLTLVIGGGPVLGSIIAATIHSSFLAVLPCTVLATLFHRKSFAFFSTSVFFGCIILLVIAYLFDIKSYLELGRRSETYEFAGILNRNYYLVALIQYGATFYLIKSSFTNDLDKWWFYMAFSFTTTALSVTLFYEAGGRLMYFASAFVTIALAQNIKKKRVVMASIFWFSIMILVQIYTDYKTSFDYETWFGRWMLILSSLGY